MKIDQQYIKNSNFRLVYSALMNCPGASRASLAETLGLSKTTVSSLVEELIQKGFVIDTGTKESTLVGRKPKHLYLKNDRHCVMVINWAPGSMTAALVCLDGKVLYKKTAVTENPANYCGDLQKLAQTALEHKKDDTEIIGTCFIISAMIDRSARRIISTTLDLGDDEAIIDNIHSIFPDTPLAFFNDTACLAYAEKIYSGIEDNPFAFINLAQGVGAAFFVDGKMFGDATGMQTQFGHYSVEPNGRPCPCGNHGCLEMMIGEKVLGLLVEECGGSSKLPISGKLRYADIGNAATDGDPAALQVLNRIADYLAFGLSNLISLIRPCHIVIGGPGVHLGMDFLTRLEHNIRSKGFQKMVDQARLGFSTLGEDACLQGAMLYYFNNYYSFTDDLQGRIFLG